MIDLHCHILPGIDDGPSEWEEAVRLARAAFADGIRTIVATPHVGDSTISAEAISGLVEELNRRLGEEGIPLEVLPGAEVPVPVPALALKPYSLNGSNYVLVEFPPSHVPRAAAEWVFGLRAAGLTPIVAHPERNPSVLRDPGILTALLGAGALAQITAASLVDPLDRDVFACARYLVGKGAVHFLATDAHSTHWRPPILSEGLRAAVDILGEDRAWRLVRAHPEAVLSGRPIHG